MNAAVSTSSSWDSVPLDLPQTGRVVRSSSPRPPNDAARSKVPLVPVVGAALLRCRKVGTAAAGIQYHIWSQQGLLDKRPMGRGEPASCGLSCGRKMTNGTFQQNIRPHTTTRTIRRRQQRQSVSPCQGRCPPLRGAWGTEARLSGSRQPASTKSFTGLGQRWKRRGRPSLLVHDKICLVPRLEE